MLMCLCGYLLLVFLISLSNVPDYIWSVFLILDECIPDNNSSSVEDVDSKLPLQLAIVGRPNVGKSTLLNALLQENRVLVGPEAGLTRDSIRVEFQYEGRDVYLVSAKIISFLVFFVLEMLYL